MEELQIRLLEGKGPREVTYAFRYPSTERGDTPFDRWWLQRVRQLRQWAVRTPSGHPTGYFSEWQETRRDRRFCSGMLEVSRRVGHGDWSLWRISATFGPTPASAVTGISSAETGISDLIASAEFKVGVRLTDVGINNPNNGYDLTYIWSYKSYNHQPL